MTRSDNSVDSEPIMDFDLPIQVQEAIQPTPSTSSSSGEASGILNTDKIKSYTPKWFKNAFK